MSAEAVGKFVSIIATSFPVKRWENESDEALWLAGMVSDLAHFGPDVLIKAANEIRRTRQPKRDGAFFPAPSECIAACEKAKRALELETIGRTMLTVDKAPTGFSPARHKLALDLLATELGIEAVKARWHGALYDFIYRNARMPKGTEIDAVKRASKEFFEAVKACERGEMGELSPNLARLGRGIAKRREDYAKSVE